eukprot:SAG22_NODE_19950_length_270_cov_0.602339_1_plen_69_part_10
MGTDSYPKFRSTAPACAAHFATCSNNAPGQLTAAAGLCIAIHGQYFPQQPGGQISTAAASVVREPPHSS